MKKLLDYVEKKRKDLEKHDFFLKLIDNDSLTGEQRLSWTPLITPLIMSYSDLNQYLFRDESNNDNIIQKELNMHTYEEDFHWHWMLDDLERLNINPNIKFTDAIRVIWSKELSASRVLVMKINKLACLNPNPLYIFAMIEMLEAASVTTFKHCVGIKTKNGEECKFFGNTHYQCEASHLIKNENNSSKQELSDDELTKSLSIVDKTFDMMISFFDACYSFAKKINSEGVSFPYSDIIDYSVNLPRAITMPEQHKSDYINYKTSHTV